MPVVYKCDLCSHTTTRRGDMKKHRLRHANDKHRDYRCDVCDYKCRNLKHLRQHLRHEHDSHETRSYQCAECAFVSASSVLLAKHVIKMHAGEATKTSAAKQSRKGKARRNGEKIKDIKALLKAEGQLQ